MRFKLVRPIGQELRPYNHHPDLLKAIVPYLEKRGHSVTRSIRDANAVLFDSEIWDMSDNDPKLPRGSYSPYSQDDFNVILQSKLPIAFFDSFDHNGTPTHYPTWPGKNDWADSRNEQDWGPFMSLARLNCKIIYFMRKMQLSVNYPEWVYPLEYPLFNDYPLATKEELFSRPNDVCFLGETGWIRQNAIKDILADGRLKADIEHVPSNKRTTLEDWIERHRKSKMFLEIDNSLGSERPMRLMTVAPMLRIKSDHRIPFPRTDMLQQVEIGDYEGHVTSDDIDKVLAVIRDPELLHSIYVAGSTHMREKYSLEAISNYVIDHLEQLCKS